MLEEGKIPDIKLPKETIYLIDKVVRRKAKQGPIGVDNSEFINLEMEKEFRKKHQHLLDLAHGKRSKETEGEDSDEEA